MKIQALAFVTVLLAACGPADEKDNNIIVINGAENSANGTPNGTPNGAANAQNLDARDQVIVDGFNAPTDAHEAAEGGLSLTIEAVVAASTAATQGAELVTTGTLTQSGQQFSYAAAPADKLVIKWTEGPQTDIYVTSLDGNFEASSIDSFFGDNHVVEARLVREGFVDYTVASNKSGGSRQGAIQGMITGENGTQYQVSLQQTGTTSADFGTGTLDYESESTMSGTISGPSFELVAEENYWFHSVSVDNLVVNRSRTANSRWTYNGKEYAVNGVFIRTATTNSYPDDQDYWRAEGSITEDGTVVGDVIFDEDQFKIDVLLRLASGETIRLDRFLKYQE